MKITRALVDVIAGNLLPFSLVESEEFAALMNVLELRYNLLSRKSMSSKLINDRKQYIEDKLCATFGSIDKVSVTVEIWTNRIMHSFLGVTVHYIENWKLKRGLLSCKEFLGRHTSENIVNNFDEVIETFHLRNKVSHVVSDSASNMTKTFEVILPQFMQQQQQQQQQQENESTNSIDPADDNDIESDAEDGSFDADAEAIDEDSTEELLSCIPDTLACFAHTLQLVIKDGMKNCRQVENAIGKVASIVNSVRKSTVSSEILHDMDYNLLM